MISHKDKLIVVNILDFLLGVGTTYPNDEMAYHCPFCHHHKKKLQVNLNSQKFHCWVCNSKGNTIGFLLRKLNCDHSKISTINTIYGSSYYNSTETETEEVVKLKLPNEFKQLNEKKISIDPNFDYVKRYLLSRGINDDIIVKYNIGYCESGIYENRIIIPSYDKDNQLNYFMARAYNETNFKYKNPPISKNVIGFENQINWKYEITLCEGVFDAIAIRRNAIPLFGKFISKRLMETIFLNKVKKIKIMLDNDAQDQANKYVNYFTKNGIQVTNIIPTEKDPSDLGFIKTQEIIRSTKATQWDDMIRVKLKGI